MTTRKSTKKAAKSGNRTASTTENIDPKSTPPIPKTPAENATHVREANLQNAPVEGTKSGSPRTREEDDIDARIKPPRNDASGTERHHIAASRGEEVPFFNVPQGGLFNVTNLKS